MLEKSLERRRINREHNSNFRAGHVAVHEAHLHKTGLRGRKGYLAVCFLMCLILVAVVNFMVGLLSAFDNTYFIILNRILILRGKQPGYCTALSQLEWKEIQLCTNITVLSQNGARIITQQKLKR